MSAVQMPLNFWSIEGLSGTGKSTVAELVAAGIEAVLVPTIPEQFEELRHHFKSARQVDARHAFFLSALLETALAIEDLLAEGARVLTESYFYRAFAYHRGMGSTLGITLPDTTPIPRDIFYLTCDEQMRQERITGRASRGPKKVWDVLSEQNIAQINSEYLGFPVHEINTTSLIPTKVADSISHHILERGCVCENLQRVARDADLLPSLHGRTSAVRAS